MPVPNLLTVAAAVIGVLLGGAFGWFLGRGLRRKVRVYRSNAGEPLATGGQARVQLEALRGENLAAKREMARIRERLERAQADASAQSRDLAELRETLRVRGERITDLEARLEALKPAGGPQAMPPARAAEPSGSLEGNGWSSADIERAAEALGMDPRQVEKWASAARGAEAELRKARAAS